MPARVVMLALLLAPLAAAAGGEQELQVIAQMSQPSPSSPPPSSDGGAWVALVAPCGHGLLQNQSWTFTAAGALRSDAAARCVDGTKRSGCGNTCGRALLETCSSPVPSAQQWRPSAPPSQLVTGGGAAGCLVIRENPLIDPGILYHAMPCKNTSNEQWQYDRGSKQLRLLCTSGTCLPWQGWCLTASPAAPPLPPPPPPPPPSPPTAPHAPLMATELYRTRVHTAGHYCCPRGQAYCNATAEMREQRCSGYYDFGSPQLLLSKNGTLLSFNQGERSGATPSSRRFTTTSRIFLLVRT